MAPESSGRAGFVWGAALVLLAVMVRLAWVLAVPTVPVSDFAMYRESANYLSEFGELDHGFIYMPGFVVLLAWIKDAGGDLLAQKMPGVFFGGLGAAALYVVTARLVDGERAGDRARGIPAPTAVVATALYALWPAGVAAASVVGTDVPAAALMLARWPRWSRSTGAPGRGRRRGRLAVGFGGDGLGAWVRAVALRSRFSAPATGSLGGRPSVVSRADRCLGGDDLLVLSPWARTTCRRRAVLHRRSRGITALIGANPNSEGTYRAFNQMFHDLTGRASSTSRTAVDRAAYARAQWTLRAHSRVGPGRAAGSLFDRAAPPLLAVFRPSVLTGRAEAWFGA
jgi:hypothetical protein